MLKAKAVERALEGYRTRLENKRFVIGFVELDTLNSLYLVF